MICGLILLLLMYKILSSWIYLGNWIFLYLFCRYALRKVLQFFISVLSPTTVNVNSITEVTAETLENQIFSDVSAINSPEETKNSFEQSNDCFEKNLKASKLVNLTNNMAKNLKSFLVHHAKQNGSRTK